MATEPLFDYNYYQFHKSLRQDLTGQTQKFKRRYKHLTPAMKMGLTTNKLQWRDLILAPIAQRLLRRPRSASLWLIAENAHKFPTSTVL